MKTTNEMVRLTEQQMRDLMSIKGAKNLKSQYEKQGGMGFFEDVGKFIIKTGVNVNDWLKKTKVISKAGKLAKFILPLVGQMEAVPVVEGLAEGAEAAGYGSEGCSCGGGPFSGAPGLSVLGMGTIDDPVLTMSRNGTWQMFLRPDIGVLGTPNFVGVNAGAPSLSMSPSAMAGAMLLGSGLGAFNVISTYGRINI